MDKRTKDLVKVFAVMAVLFLTACGNKTVEKVKIPELKIQCPDPDGRTRLEQGATYRDLALSRAEALAGWRRCFDALAISQRHG
jgi:outer membrane lipopolysaccharide assembly protein LptE/RlpB